MRSAKTDVADIVDSIGLATVDLRGLAEDERLGQFPRGPLPALNLV
ncbi:MAG: hypothetical protein WDO56_10865 [Gammaproteobacteria bacterium]